MNFYDDPQEEEQFLRNYARGREIGLNGGDQPFMGVGNIGELAGFNSVDTFPGPIVGKPVGSDIHIQSALDKADGLRDGRMGKLTLGYHSEDYRLAHSRGMAEAENSIIPETPQIVLSAIRNEPVVDLNPKPFFIPKKPWE